MKSHRAPDELNTRKGAVKKLLKAMASSNFGEEFSNLGIRGSPITAWFNLILFLLRLRRVKTRSIARLVAPIIELLSITGAPVASQIACRTGGESFSLLNQ